MPHGGGDLFAALVLAGLLADRALPDVLQAAVGGVFEILAASLAAASEEMVLVGAQEVLLRPSPAVSVTRLG